MTETILHNKLTVADIKKVIIDKKFFIIPSTTTTVCQLTLQNGYIVVGTSACVDLKNFDKDIGERFAYDEAESIIWQLEGYLLKQRLYEKQLAEVSPEYPDVEGPDE